MVSFLLLMSFVASLGATNVGLPPTRFYSLDDIGALTPGFHIGFDSIGRISAVQYNKYMVLNDNEWINLIEEGEPLDYSLSQVEFGENGSAYFSSHGNWGMLEKKTDGKYVPVAVSPDVRSEWTLASEFENILPTENGVFFYNWNGLVFMDEESGEQTIMRIDGLEEIFELKGQWYVSIFGNGLKKLSLSEKRLDTLEVDGFQPMVAVNATLLEGDRALFTQQQGGFYSFDGSKFAEWKTELEKLGSFVVSACCSLIEGDLVVALEGRGIYILSALGEIKFTLTGAEFLGVREIVTAEKGVFWYATDNGIGKVHYGSGITIVDRHAGLQIAWPEFVNSKDTLFVSSNNIMYRSKVDRVTGLMSFVPIEGQPKGLNYSVTVLDDNILIGNNEGIYMKKPGGRFEHVFKEFDVNRVVTLSNHVCLVIGSKLISAVKLEHGQLVECADRIEGFGFPSVLHKIGDVVWLELGLNRVARVALNGDRLESILIDEFPWDDPVWINIGSIGNRVILSGRDSDRIYFDESSNNFCEAPELDEILNLCPFGAFRTVVDRHGTIWVSHIYGVSAIRKIDDKYVFDPVTAGINQDPTPILRVIGNDLWIISKNALHHLRTDLEYEPISEAKPVLDGVYDIKTGNALNVSLHSGDLGLLDYNQNHLRFRFFSGTYAWDFLQYKIELRRGTSNWSIPGAQSQITIPNLKEGDYDMVVSLVNSGFPVGQPLQVHFTINPPWYRSGWAYTGYAVAVFAFVLLMSSVPVMFVRSRNKMLSRLVDERTFELQQTMERLREEEKLTAVHEERSRIAGEIHDSVQQGLSALKLILDSTLKYDSLREEIRNRLQKAKTILAFTHQEVKYAVWGMETPLLEDQQLLLALQRVTSLVDSKQRHILVESRGTEIALPTSINHHLVRITQESITNAIRHGDAHQVTVCLDYQQDHVVLKISDDGCGFDVDEATKSPHQLGLRGMLNRVERFKGEVNIESEINSGTVIEIRIPIAKREME